MIPRRHSGYAPDGTRRLYKGGDGGAADLRAQEVARQAKVQAAVDAVNQTFGKGPVGAAPTQAQFTKAPSAGIPAQDASYLETGREGGSTYVPAVAAVPASAGGFDQAGFDAATAGYNAKAGAGAARQAGYDDIAAATTEAATRDLDKQFTTAGKQNLFGLARAGLVGGSVDAEASGDLAQRYGEGKIKATQAGVGAASELQSADEKTRQNLISLAQSGIDTGTAASLAAGQSAAAADTARANAGGATVGRLFDDLGQTYLQNTALKARYPNGLPTTGSGGLYSSLFNGKGYGGTVSP